MEVMVPVIITLYVPVILLELVNQATFPAKSGLFVNVMNDVSAA